MNLSLSLGLSFPVGAKRGLALFSFLHYSWQPHDEADSGSSSALRTSRVLLGPRLPVPRVALLLPPWCLWAFLLTPLLLHFCPTHDPAGHSPLLAFALFLKCSSSPLHRIAPASLAGVCPPLERSPPPSSCCSSHAGSQWWVLRGGCQAPALTPLGTLVMDLDTRQGERADLMGAEQVHGAKTDS